jgi:acyl-CoA thioesterase FadM
MSGAGDEELGDLPFSEGLVSRRPLIVRRRVLWGECDPAGVVYTPRFADYLVSAFQWFARCELADTGLAELGIGTPMKAMSLEFHRMLKPGEWFDMRVAVTAVRTRTFDLDVQATGDDGRLHFIGLLTPIMLDNEKGVGVEIPDVTRARLQAYGAAAGI